MSANEFRVSAFYEQGVGGHVVTVQVRQRINGAANLVLSGGFLFDLASLPALRAELERICAVAEQNGDLNDNHQNQVREDTHD